MNSGKIRVLLGSPIRQQGEILRHFLSSIRELELRGLAVDYFFVDDNTERESREQLDDFAAETPNTFIMKGPQAGEYICNDVTHIWEEELIWKVAEFKNIMIEAALQGGYDYLFLVDSDLILHPMTLLQLVSLKKDIIAEIFWTKWEPDYPEMPQVWAADQYDLFYAGRGEELTQPELMSRVKAFISMLKVPGVYKVGGLGACTLIGRTALEKGVNFNEIYNIKFIGEDRHFCIRAAALGFALYVDTHYPACHIYRLSDLDGAAEHKKNYEEIQTAYIKHNEL